MPSDRYDERKPLFDSLFGNGVDRYIHPTGVIGFKLVVGVEETVIDAFRISPYGRSASSGSVSIFLADTEETAKAEVFRGNPPSGYPPNTWLLQYEYSGTILNIQKIESEDFKAQFLRASGDHKHEFSQDARFYLEQNGFTQGFDSIGWVSVQGNQIGQGGFVYNWISGVAPQFTFLGMTRLDNPGGAKPSGR